MTRAYTYTWVNIYGEESAPALPVTGAGNANGTWTSAIIQDPTTEFTGFADYQKKRLYRTVTAESGTAVYYKVADIPAGTTTYADNCTTLTDAMVVNNLPWKSTSWQPPPTTLKGFIAMPNGFLIGFDGNTIYMSESYHFHAWPAEYQQATETPIVGLGMLGQTCVVCTQGYPTTVTGSKPATCSFTKATTGEPCMSRGSIVSTPQGVIYASQNGLVLIGPSGIENVTEKLITKDEWIRHYSPAFIRAVRYQNGYLALRMPPPPTHAPASILDPTSLKVALTELTDFADIVAINTDFWSGEVLPLKAGMVRRWDPPTDDLMPVLWKSKEFQFQYQENFGCLRHLLGRRALLHLQLRHCDHADQRARPLCCLRRSQEGLRPAGAAQRQAGPTAVRVQGRHLAVRNPRPRAGLFAARRLDDEGAEDSLMATADASNR